MIEMGPFIVQDLISVKYRLPKLYRSLSELAHRPSNDDAGRTVKYRLLKGTIRSVQGLRIVLFERRCWTTRQVSSPGGADTFPVQGLRIVLFERRCWTTKLLSLVD